MFKTFYRIVQTGPKPTYAAEYRVWWWPFYLVCFGPGLDENGNRITIQCEKEFPNVYQAEAYAIAHARYRNKSKFKPSVVEHLGPL